MDNYSQSAKGTIKFRDHIFLVIIAVFFVFYTAVFIARTSFAVTGFADETRAFVLFDDAMISMRYARNLADGHGLVWNPGGERVEGYTNPGWVFLMAVAHKLPVSTLKVSLLIQIAGAVFLLFNILATYAVGRWLAPRAPAVAITASLLTAFYYPLNYWGLTGMEVSLCVLVVMAAVLLIRHGRYLLSLLLVGASIWLRLDMAVIFCALWAHCFLFRPERRLSLAIWPAVFLITALGSQTAWRIWYYGDPFPNTYYLKMTGFPTPLRILRGAVHFIYFLLRSTWPILLTSFVALLLVRRGRLRFRRFTFMSLSVDSPLLRSLTLLSSCFLAQAAYSAYVGGDAWERLIAANRFISVVIPLFFILYAFGLHRLVKVIAPTCSSAVFALLVLISLVNFNSFPRRESIAQWLLVERPTFTEINAENFRFAIAVKQVTTPDAVLAVDAAGVIPYFADRKAIDLLGKCDPVIAREPMHRHVMTHNPLLEFYPGHLKWNYAYSIGRLQPDVVMSRWGRAKTNSDEFLIPLYARYEISGLETWLLKNSPHVKITGT